MIDQLKDLKDTYEAARQQIDRGKEPMDELVKINNFLYIVSENPQVITETQDKDYKRYFLDDFTTGLLKRLTKERSRDDKYLEVIASILENYTKIFIQFLKLRQLNQQFFDSIKFIFEYDSTLHNYNYQIPEEQLKQMRNTNQEWRKALKAGDMVDAIVDEYNNRASGWSQARISSVNEDVLGLEFIYDTKNVDRFCDRWSVEIAPFESKTKEIWDWKANINTNDLVDAHDKTVWNQSTILEIRDQQVGPDRNIKMLYIGYRVYQENGAKSDERGTFNGWSNRFDEWVPLYSPRIMPIYSKTQKGMQDDHDLDEDFDTYITPEEGFFKVYAVPRIRKCISSVFIHLINLFGNQEGYDLVLDLIQNHENDEDSNLDLNILASLVHCISHPYLIYHKEFIQEYGPKFVQVCIQRLRGAPEKSLRDVRREKIENIIKSIDNFQRRLIPREEREKQTEILKLEIALMCLRSSFMERRIQGIRDLNQIIKNNRMFSNKSFSPKFLIEWLHENDVFGILFDSRRTHLQLIQRSNDIIRLLLQENMFTHQLMEMFWSLASKGEYKIEIYKIINEVAFILKQEHIDFFFDQITQIPIEKLAIEEFQCLSELGKYAREENFKVRVSEFFWKIICNSDQVKEELVQNCITKFCEMVKNWDVAKKHEFFVQLTKNLSENKSSIPSLRLFKGLVKDQKEKGSYSQNNSPQKATQGSQEVTITQSLDTLINEHQLIQVLLNNLKAYCHMVKGKQIDQAKDRKKLFIVNSKYSHHDEIDERLQFLKYVAQITPNYHISKFELGEIYELLVTHSNIPSDSEEFLLWCKSSCEQSNATTQILDLNEVGEFFTEKMKSGELDVTNLIDVGFDFLQQYFLSVNETQHKLIKASKPQNKNKYGNNNYQYTSITYGYNSQGMYGPKQLSYNYGKGKKSEEQEDQKIPTFKLTTTPNELDQIDIVWNIALHCQNPKVVPKAINFLIRVYYSLDADLDEQKIEIQSSFIQKCMDILQSSQDEKTLSRVIDILKHIIYEAEKKGTGDVQPHNALLKGELLQRIVIKNKASPKGQNIVMSIYSNTTFWEFKKEVARQFDLAPKYLKLEKQNGETIKDTCNGKTLAELGFTNNEHITAIKQNIEEEVPNAPLTGQDGKLTEKARQIFNEWFDMYSDEKGGMTKDTCAQFIKGCTGEIPPANDDRIQNLFKIYDSNNDGRIEREEFLSFYEQSARQKPDTVRENLRAHNIRFDLKKLSEVQEESSFKKEDMPRFRISKNQEHFDQLMSLLDRNDKVSEESWNLIQMLATNQELYKRVLQLKTALDPQTGKIEWSKFFDGQSIYKLLYTLQIVEAVMEEGEGEGLERVVIVDENEQRKGVPSAPPLPGNEPQTQTDKPEEQQSLQRENTSETRQELLDIHSKKQTSILVEENEDKQLRTEWTSMFLQHNGFQYILKVFMDKEIHSQDENQKYSQFELKHIAFLLKLLRIFIMAAFSTSNESQVYTAANLIRRTSSVQEDDNTSQPQQEVTEGSRFKELQKLLAGPIGEDIIEQIDYKKLQSKILNIISQILTKKNMIFEDKLIIENALSLWVGCVLHKHDLFNDFYSFRSDEVKDCDSFILSGLLFCDQEKIREEFKQSLSCISQKLIHADRVKQLPLQYLLKLLSENFSLISSYHCKQYFELFCELIDFYFLAKNLSHNEGGQVFNPENLLALIIDKIKEYNQQQGQDNKIKAITETEKQTENEDNNSGISEQEEIYIGLIQLTGKIIDNFDISFSEKIVQQKNLIDEIFVQFLFSSVFKQDQGKNSLDNLKIKPQRTQKSDSKKKSFGKKSKDAAYKLLNSLIRKSPLLMKTFLEKSMIPLMKLIRKHDGWSYQPPNQTDKVQKYVGLRNPSCICYMNSILQQFFMVPAFRYNLLSVDDNVPEDLVEHKGNMVDDNVLHQFQKLVAHLELSERIDYSPIDFCFSFKDFEGNPTNLSEQKDAQEFLTIAFDRLENLLRSTTRKYLLQSVFGGQTCNQFVCLECGKVKNRIEDFYYLSLTVKDIKSVYDSLQTLLNGETINDYECDNCKKKVDISKRQLISQTPNVLIVHLQRLIFNFDTFRNDKLNSHFEFPYQLDLKPYSFYEVMRKEGRLKKPTNEDEDGDQQEQQEQKNDDENPWPEEEDCFEYKLVGTIVHSGSAQAGHYWSYINTRRGYMEPNESDEDWNKTEQDPWLEFNDSTVRDLNFEKIKEDCFGGDGKGGNDDAWGFGGNYGRSAYMLVYERRKKKPLKILATEDEIQTQKDKLQYDQKRDEYFKLVDYRECANDIVPNKIYKQVFEDNQKFEFENDIYSQEFFDFVKGILQAVSSLDSHRQNQGEILEKVKEDALFVGKKVILELLAKCFYNSGMRGLVDALIDIMKKDDNVCKMFMQQCFQEDNCNYLLDILLDCTDSSTRANVATLLKFVLNRLKVVEKDILYDMEKSEQIDSKGQKYTVEQYKALSSRFIAKCLGLLNTQVAKAWSRFDNFLDMLYSYAVGDTNDQDEVQDVTGLEFLFRNKFIEKSCDFLLGRKSPMNTPGEKRFEMGGSFTSPNFTPIIKIITKMIVSIDLLDKYPLSEMEKKMFMHHDLLKIMLGTPGSSKQFGKCLAQMCKDNLKLSQKISKVYIKSINNSNFDNVKSYLSALKPFLKLQDSLKLQRLEWVFGISQINSRKPYREERYKYGLEFVDRINEEANTYISPIANAAQEESLLAQLLKCKGKLDTFAINCLQEMLSLMAKDDDIARFVYNAAPPTYQHARYSDWIRPYLESQRQDAEKNVQYAYVKNKYDSIITGLKYLDIFEQKTELYREEERQGLEKARAEGNGFDEIEQDWLAYKYPEVIEHFPPQLIISKQQQDDKEVMVFDEDPLVKVTLYEISCEYNYSNPTGWFNLSLPHIEVRTNTYQTMSYAQFKQMQAEHDRKQASEESTQGSPSEGSDQYQDPQDKGDKNEIMFEEPKITVRNWFEHKKVAPVLLKVVLHNKTNKKIGVRLQFEPVDGVEANVLLPHSQFKESLMDNENKFLVHLQRIDLRKPWGQLKVNIQSKDYSVVPVPPANKFSIGVHSATPGGNTMYTACPECKLLNDYGQDFCEKCGTSLHSDYRDHVMENYFATGDHGANSMY